MSANPFAANATLPTIALAMGDPAGVGSELTAKLLSLDEVRAAANIVVFGDRRILEEGAKIAGVALDISYVAPDAEFDATGRPVFVDLGHLFPADVKRGEATAVGGAYALKNFRRALTMAHEGKADAVCFTPFNKKAMRMSIPATTTRSFLLRVIGFTGHAREFNVLENLWNARVTSHIPLSAVASSITAEGILGELALTDRSLRDAGLTIRALPWRRSIRMPVTAAISAGRKSTSSSPPSRQAATGINVSGPYPADTVFVRARVAPLTRS